jgi:hypothetical protein
VNTLSSQLFHVYLGGCEVVRLHIVVASPRVLSFIVHLREKKVRQVCGFYYRVRPSRRNRA